MADIRKVEIDREFLVLLKGKVLTNQTDKELAEIFDNLHETIKEVICNNIVDDGVVSVEPVKRGENGRFNGRADNGRKRELADLVLRSELEAEKRGIFNCSRSEYKAEIIADFLLQNGVSVIPINHGNWVYGEYDIPHCSECGNEVMPDKISNYCPNCGAKMEGERFSDGD